MHFTTYMHARGTLADSARWCAYHSPAWLQMCLVLSSGRVYATSYVSQPSATTVPIVTGWSSWTKLCSTPLLTSLYIQAMLVPAHVYRNHGLCRLMACVFTTACRPLQTMTSIYLRRMTTVSLWPNSSGAKLFNFFGSKA